MSSTLVDAINGVTTSVAVKAPCALATTSNITLSGEQTIDGTLTSETRVLVKNQTDGTKNGIYKSGTSAWNREADFDGNRDVVEGTLIPVNRGTTNADTMWRVSTTGAIVIGTTSIDFEPAGMSDSSTVAFAYSGVGAAVSTLQALARSNFINAAVFGVPTDGTDGTTVMAALMAAHLNIYMPPGSYLFSSALTLRNGHTIIGAGRLQTIITSGVIGDSLFKNAGAYTGFIHMADMQLIGNGLTGASGNGHAINLIDPTIDTVTPYSPAQSTFERLYIRDFRGEDTRDNSATQINAAAIICVNGLGNVFRDISIDDCGHGFFMHRTQNCRIIEPLVTGCDIWGLLSYDNENLNVIGGDINNSGTDGVTDATGYIEAGMGTGNVLSARDEDFLIDGAKQKNSPGVAQTHLYLTIATVRGGWLRADHEIDKEFIGVQVTNPIDVDIDGVTFSPTSGAAYSATRKITHVKVNVATTHNIAKARIRRNKFRTQGGTLVAACVHLKGAAGVTRMEGLEVTGNSFGTPQNVAAATTIDTDVLFDTGAFRNCNITDNNHYDATNVTKTAHYVAASATFAENAIERNSFSSQVSGAIDGIYTDVVPTHEEGAWTPVLIGLSSAGAGTYTLQKGSFVKKGKVVTYTCALTWTAHTGTGSMRITGLPYTSSANASMVYPSGNVVSDLTFPGTGVAASIPANTDYLNIQSVASGSAAAGLAMDTAATVWISGTYETEA